MKPVVFTVLFGFVVFLVIRSSRKRSAIERQCKEAFELVFSNAAVKPKYEQRYSYGYPALTVTFLTKSDLDDNIRTGTTKDFSDKIGEICRSPSSAKFPFDAGRAIWFTYEGEIVTSLLSGE